MFKALKILVILSSLKSKEGSLDWVINIWLMRSTMLFFKGVKCLLLSAFHLKNYYLQKEIQSAVFCVVKRCVDKLPVGFCFQQRII